MLDSFATVAANAALGFGAGGIVIAGGIVPKLGRLFAVSLSRACDHGRRRTFLDRLPLYISLDPFAGLRGAAALDNPHMASRVVMIDQSKAFLGSVFEDKMTGQSVTGFAKRCFYS